MRNRSAVVSLIGRPNVGKSTVFNRLMKKSFKAMTFDQPGVTRDRHYDICSVESPTGENPTDIIVVDTGGFYPEKVEEDKRRQRAPAEPFFDQMAEQAKLAIEESDLILFVVDVREGLLPFDKTIADYIRTTKKKMWLLINKFDSDKQWGDEADFYELGLSEDQFLIISAEHNRGLEDLKGRLYDFAQDFEQKEIDDKEIQRGVTPNHDVVGSVAIIGAPNAGKSTLLNRFVGAQRALVSDIPGATVDPIEAYFDLFFGDKAKELDVMDDKFRKNNMALLEEFQEYEDQFAEDELLAYDQMPYDQRDSSEDEDDSEIVVPDEDLDEDELFKLEDLEKSLDDDEEDASEIEVLDVEEIEPYRSIKIIDTAGIRKQKRVQGFIEEQSVYRSLKAITESEVVIFMVDATKGITHQDRRLCDIALEKGKSLIICLNKVDLMKDIMNDGKKKREWLLDLRATIPWLGYCELIPISAKKGSFFSHLKRSLMNTMIIRRQKISTGRLNKAVTYLVDKQPIVLNKSSGSRFKVKYASMLKASPPTFLFFTNKSQGIPANYRRYLQNGLRREFQLVNTPVHLIFRTSTDIEKRLRKSVAKS
ncbi:MAG: 50S ribosome-binding GTPase [Bacteriovoracaceae bacterium]|nr:50S ribosome-binding GTPase [Bacteriovoracaceae bacterium]